MDFIKTPINYTGNKYRLLPQLNEFLPKQTKVFVDLFCGGATVGYNVNAEKIILIDNNKRVINLLEFLAKCNIEKVILDIYKVIEEYNLSNSYLNKYQFYRDQGFIDGNNGLKNYNKDGFLRLRDDYNKLKNKNTRKANIMLYVLMVYGFNNDLRFNSSGEFNLPIGKTDFNKNNHDKLIAFNRRAKEINYSFLCGDFRDASIQEIILGADFVYCDPPYLITKAFYNENNGWNEEMEYELLHLLLSLHENTKHFALSNVIAKTNCKNKILSDWVTKNKFNIHLMDYNYRTSSYNKINREANEQEVLITNY